jgi:hypothetical protein
MNFTHEQKAEHLRLLAIAFYQNMNEHHDESDGLGLAGKRPFGNSGYYSDVLEIIEVEPEDLDDGDRVWSDEQREYGYDLLDNQLGPYLVKHGVEYFTKLKP